MLRPLILFSALVFFSFAACADDGERGPLGPQGVTGNDGSSALTVLSTEPKGEHCAHGGVRIDTGLDANADGELSEEEIASTQYICAARPGLDGACSNNVAPTIDVNPPSLPTYWVGSEYLMTVTANKEGLDYRFAAQNLKFERIPGEVQSEAGFVSTWKMVPLAEARFITATVIVSDGCQLATVEFHLKDIRNELIDWVNIPAGSFQSAVPNSGNISLNAFKLARTSTTVAQFQECVAAGACLPGHFESYEEQELSLEEQELQEQRNHYRGLCNEGRGDEWLNHPMNCMTWIGAQQFCEWVGGRLPTEDEWQYAATSDENGARETTYPWGDDEPIHCVHVNSFGWINFEDRNWYCDGADENNLIVGTSAIGTYSPLGDSPLGLQDMAGNIYDWTASIWEDDASFAMYKGRGYSDSWIYIAVDERDQWEMLDWHVVLGFRCAQ